MKISEMTEDQVRDYALKLEGEKQAWSDKEKEYIEQINEVNGLNKALQKRNNDLFIQVEQQGATDTGTPAKEKEEESTETCEDFARRLIEGGKK